MINKPITRPMHGIADISYAALVPAAPKLFKFEEEKSASTLCYALGGGALLYSLFTRYEWGLVRVLPFKSHLAIDVAASVLALGAPWLFGFSKNTPARNTFLAIGLTGLTIGSLTQTEEMDDNDNIGAAATI